MTAVGVSESTRLVKDRLYFELYKSQESQESPLAVQEPVSPRLAKGYLNIQLVFYSASYTNKVATHSFSKL